MKKHLLLTLLCIGSATLYTANYTPDANTDSSSKRFQDEDDDDDDATINALAAQLRQKAAENDAITLLAESLRQECESEGSLDGAAAAICTQLQQITAHDIAAELPEATAAPIADTRPSLNGFIFHTAGQPCNANSLALIRSDRFKKRIKDALDEDTFFNVKPNRSVSCKGSFYSCNETHYKSKNLLQNKNSLKSHCVDAHLKRKDVDVITSLIIKITGYCGNNTRYKCAICPPEKFSPKLLAYVRTHIVTAHILDNPAAKKPSTI